MEFIIRHNGVARRINGNFIIAGTKHDLLVLFGALKEQAQALEKPDTKGSVTVSEPDVNQGNVSNWEG